MLMLMVTSFFSRVTFAAAAADVYCSARGIASIRAGLEASNNTNSNRNSSKSSRGSSSSDDHSGSYVMGGALLLRGILDVPPSTLTNTISNSPCSRVPCHIINTLTLSPPASTFLHLPGGWGRGEVWVNGNSLGRYWAGQGPQMSLYLPGSFLVPGPNEVVVMELEGRVPVDSSRPARTLPSIHTAAEPDFKGPPGGVQPL